MKRISVYKVLSILSLPLIFLAGCTKESSNVRLDPQLSTTQVLNVKSDSATVVGFVVAAGSGFTEKGVCYSTQTGPSVSDSKTPFTGTVRTATFNVKIGGLNYATKYYARAYATGGAGTIYGEEVSFTTLPVVPVLTTANISTITGNSAAGGGNVTVAGGAEVTARGVCFGTSHNPTVTGSKTTDGQGLGAFTSALTGLLGNSVYYVRAYATNSAGTGYGPEVSFTTLVDLPKVTTTAVTVITKTSAKSGGNVTYDGGGTVTARGLVWGLVSNPTTADNVIVSGSGTGQFDSTIVGLTKFTVYHVRAFATNNVGTAYGNDVQFTTLGDNLTWNIPGNYVAASYPGTAYADWSPGSSPQVKSTISSPDNLEGYVYMATASNEWKFATQNDWSGPNYGAGATPGVLDPNGGNIVSPAGYYKINANAATMTYTAVATVWGVIGDATPQGWNDETPLTYSPAFRAWTGSVHLTAASFKFRANHDWGYNYGSTAANATLDAGGSNIAVTVESDYAFTLDLSQPNAYTYTANRWGVIGDATAGGWGSDQNMTWDAVHNVFTVTLDLVVGSFKFRANDDWAVNYGGTDLNNLTQGGDNIAVATAGNYTLTFNPWSHAATVTKN